MDLAYLKVNSVSLMAVAANWSISVAENEQNSMVMPFCVCCRHMQSLASKTLLLRVVLQQERCLSGLEQHFA